MSEVSSIAIKLHTHIYIHAHISYVLHCILNTRMYMDMDMTHTVVISRTVTFPSADVSISSNTSVVASNL